VDGHLTRLWSNRFNQKPADSLELYFSPDSIDLSDAAQTALVAVIKALEVDTRSESWFYSCSKNGT
jgi:hypothetical protein